MGTYNVTYRIMPADNEEKVTRYRVTIDEDSGESVRDDKREQPPAWTELEFHQCPNCPLKKEDTPRCPVAVNIHELISSFRQNMSVEDVKVVVNTPQRIFAKQTDMQSALGSLFGLIMATSPCPKMKFLRPMARFHLPFSSIEETVFRSLGSFLISKLMADSLVPDEVVAKLLENYEELNVINAQMLERIHELVEKDAGDSNQNAIVILDSLATLLSMELTTDLDILKPFYEDIE